MFSKYLVPAIAVVGLATGRSDHFASTSNGVMD